METKACYCCDKCAKSNSNFSMLYWKCEYCTKKHNNHKQINWCTAVSVLLTKGVWKMCKVCAKAINSSGTKTDRATRFVEKVVTYPTRRVDQTNSVLFNYDRKMLERVMRLLLLLFLLFFFPSSFESHFCFWK